MSKVLFSLFDGVQKQFEYEFQAYENVNFILSDNEMKINDLLNFLNEKEQSGEGISTEEDAKFLMNSLEEMEKSMNEQ